MMAIDCETETDGAESMDKTILVHHQRSFWTICLLLSVGVRVAVAFYYGNWVPTEQDDYSYSQLAWRLATGHGYSFDRAWYPFTPADTPTAHWSFLYTALVAGIYRMVGYVPVAARLVNAVATGLLLPLAVHRLARRTFPRRQEVAAVAALCTSGYAYFVLFAARIMTEGLYMVALLWSLDSAIAMVEDFRRRSAVPLWHGVRLGFGLGIAALLRQSILPWVPVLFGWLLVAAVSEQRLRRVASSALPGSRLRRLAPLVVAGLILIGCILPWTIRNYIEYNQPLLLNSNTGYAMYSAQHPMHGTDFQEHAAAPLPEDLRSGESLTEPEWSRALMRRGVDFVLADPVRYIRLSASRVLDFYEFWPTPDTPLLHNIGRLISFTAFLPFMVYGSVVALNRARKASTDVLDFIQQPVVLLMGFACFYTLLHILTWAMPRYRIPVDAVMMPFAALAWLDLYQVLQRHMIWLPASEAILNFHRHRGS